MNFSTSGNLVTVSNGSKKKSNNKVLNDDIFEVEMGSYDTEGYKPKPYEPMMNYNREFEKLSTKEIGSVGDVNRDGIIDDKDVSFVSSYIVNADPDLVNKLMANGLYNNHESNLYKWLEENKDYPNIDEILKHASNGTYPIDPLGPFGNVYGEDGQINPFSSNKKNYTDEERQKIQEEYSKKIELINFCKMVITSDKNSNLNYNVDYDINGDGSIDVMDATTLQQYIELEYDNAISKDPNKSMINTSGKFSEWTDYQNVSFVVLDLLRYFIKDNEEAKEYSNMTISELCNKIKQEGDNDYIYDQMKTLIDNGFGDYKIVEIAHEGSFDAMVIQDKDGNYRIFYNSTNQDQPGDLLYDSRNILREQLDESYTRTGATGAGGVVEGIAGGILGFIMGASGGSWRSRNRSYFG